MIVTYNYTLFLWKWHITLLKRKIRKRRNDLIYDVFKVLSPVQLRGYESDTKLNFKNNLSPIFGLEDIYIVTRHNLR